MNEAFMLLRRRRGFLEVLPENPDDGMKSISETFVDQSPNPEQSYWQRECTDLLTEAIDRLNSRIGRTIFLRDIEERSVKETAQILGASISAVKAAISRTPEVAQISESWIPTQTLRSRSREAQQLLTSNIDYFQ